MALILGSKTSVQEGVEVLAIDPDADDGILFDPDLRPFDPRYVAVICPSLVAIIVPVVVKRGDRVVSSDWSPLNGPEELWLTSPMEYLISEHSHRADRPSFYHFNKSMGDVTISKTCLAYLLQVSRPGCIYSSTRKPHPLSDYAARHWMEHAPSDGAYSDTFN